MRTDATEGEDADGRDPTGEGDATRSPDAGRIRERARYLLAVDDRVDELEELRASLSGRAPMLAGMLGPLYFYGGIFLLATGAVVLVFAVVEPGTDVVRLVGAVLLCGVGWLAVVEGRELRRAVPGTRERMIELEDELAELRGGEEWPGVGRTGEAEDGRDGQTRSA